MGEASRLTGRPPSHIGLTGPEVAVHHAKEEPTAAGAAESYLSNILHQHRCPNQLYLNLYIIVQRLQPLCHGSCERYAKNQDQPR